MHLPEDRVAFLTGQLANTPYPAGISLPGEGGKFASDGSVLRWPGNTFVCHVPAHSASHAAISALQEELMMSRFAPFIVFLPPASFHMTVFQGISPDCREDDQIPTGADSSMSLEQLNSLMLKLVEGCQFESSRRVAMVDLLGGMSMLVEGTSEAESGRLRSIREQLRAVTGIKPASFESYRFHITLGYLGRWLTESTARKLLDFSDELMNRHAQSLGDIELGAVEFCTFDTMHHFEPGVRLARP